jgi:copper transport protein
MSKLRNLRRITPCIVFLSALAVPAPAFAHAHLVRSLPASGAHVASISVIRLWFSERTVARLTSVTLRDQNGVTFSLSTPQAAPNDQTQITVSVLAAIPAGHYTLDWHTVASDGHPSQGQFSFTVVGQPQVSTPGAVQTTSPASSTPASTTAPVTAMATDQDASASTANSLARAVSFAGILLVIGVVVFNLLVLARSANLGSELVWQMEARAATVGLGAGILVMAGAFARVFLESRMMSGMPGMESMNMTTMFLHTLWGFGMQLQIMAAFLAVIAFSIAIPRVRFAWLIASLAALGLAFAPALAGHAAASARFPAAMILTDFLHVGGAASWLGNLACVMLIGIPIIIRAESEDRWQRVAALVNTFSPIALASATIVVLSGVIAAAVHLEKLSALWSTTYGRVLLLKVAVVLVTLAIGAYNFRRVQPQLVREEGVGQLRRSATMELTTATLVVLITGFLTGVSP